MTVWFDVAWNMSTTRSGIPASHVYRVLPVNSYQTAWSMLGKLRSVMGTQESEPLRGRVEVDETYLGGPRPGASGRGAAGKTLVAGAIEIRSQGWGRARLAVIPNASAESLRSFITSNIDAGATVVTDAWTAYPPALRDAYVHDVKNVKASGEPAHASLPAVHRLFSLVQRMIDGTYQGSVGDGHMQEYLDEFVFRFNRRKSRDPGLIFMRLLARAVGAPPITYQALVRDSQAKAIRPRGLQGSRSRPRTLETDTIARPWRYPRATR